MLPKSDIVYDVKRKCLWCGKKFAVKTGPNQKTCNKQCATFNRRRNWRKANDKWRNRSGLVPGSTNDNIRRLKEAGFLQPPERSS